MKTKVISPEEYHAMSRQDKRFLKRQAEKEGRIIQEEKFRQRTQVRSTVDSEYLKAGLEILDENNIKLEDFLDLSFQNLILANEKNLE